MRCHIVLILRRNQPPLALLVLYCVLTEILRECCEKPKIAIVAYIPFIISVSPITAVPRETTRQENMT